ncbi:hypothetical protein HYV71_03125 [Candidatus Uhrbacteria bacterium]|nr:hypothetical protein [Candidatus Uhrbacteria bacterium]
MPAVRDQRETRGLPLSFWGVVSSVRQLRREAVFPSLFAAGLMPPRWKPLRSRAVA